MKEIPGYMFQEKGDRPTGPDGIMVKVFETIHNAALDTSRVVIAEPRSLMLAGFDLHDVLGRTLVSEPITMHWKQNGKLGCSVPVGEAEVTSIHCSAFRYLLLKDSFCSLCMEAARKALDEEAED